MNIELQPIVGSACVLCQQRILVDLDGRNCRTCGAAVHRSCARSHREKCSTERSIPRTGHDYDEVAPFAWTPRAIGLIAAPVFVLFLGFGLFTSAGESPSSARLALQWTAVAVGALGTMTGFLVEHSLQRRVRR